MGKMRKFLCTAIMASTLPLLTGCIKGDIEEYYYEGSTVFVDYVIAPENAWYAHGTPRKEGSYMFQTFSFPEITTQVLEDGFVLVFMVDQSIPNGRDNILPFILPYNDRSTENIRYDYEKGKLTVIIESSDFVNYPRTGPLLFKICIMYP